MYSYIFKSTFISLCIVSETHLLFILLTNWSSISKKYFDLSFSIFLITQWTSNSSCIIQCRVSQLDVELSCFFMNWFESQQPQTTFDSDTSNLYLTW